MNHCLLEVTVKVAPTIRYTQDNQTAIAEMDVAFDGLRSDDPPGLIKVVGWGNLARAPGQSSSWSKACLRRTHKDEHKHKARWQQRKKGRVHSL